MHHIVCFFQKFNNFGAVRHSLLLMSNLKNTNVTILFLENEISNAYSHPLIKNLKKKNINFFFLDEILPYRNFLFLKFNKIIHNKLNLREYVVRKKLKKILKQNDNSYFYLNSSFDRRLYILDFINYDKSILHLHYSFDIDNEDIFPKKNFSLIDQFKNIIVNNQITKEKLIKNNIPEKKINILGIAVDKNNWKKNKYSAIKFKKKMNMSKHILIGASGQISLRKGSDIFLDIAEKYIKNNNIKFIWLGGISHTLNKKNNYSNKELRDKFNKMKNITIINPRNNAYKIFNALDIFLIPSRDEVGPLTLIENLFLGNIVISHRNCGIVSKVLKNEDTNMLDFNVPEHYKNQIDKILNNLVKSNQVNNLNVYEIENQIEKFYEKYFN